MKTFDELIAMFFGFEIADGLFTEPEQDCHCIPEVLINGDYNCESVDSVDSESCEYEADYL